MTIVGIAGELSLRVKKQACGVAEFRHIIVNLRSAPLGDGLQSPARTCADYRLACAFLIRWAVQRRGGNLVPCTDEGRVGCSVAGKDIAVKPFAAAPVPATVRVAVRRHVLRGSWPSCRPLPRSPREFKQQVIKNRIGLYSLGSRADADHSLREGLDRIEPAVQQLGQASVQADAASEIRQHAPDHVMPAIAVAPFRPRLGKKVKDNAVPLPESFKSLTSRILVPALKHPHRIRIVTAQPGKYGSIGLGDVRALNAASLMERIHAVETRAPHNFRLLLIVEVGN